VFLLEALTLVELGPEELIPREQQDQEALLVFLHLTRLFALQIHLDELHQQDLSGMIYIIILNSIDQAGYL
jgi:hypothetical protein